MMDKPRLDALIEYAEDAKEDGYPFEVDDLDLDLVLDALKRMKASG